MFPRWWRLGIRPQLTLIVVLGAVLSTIATLFIANTVVSSYVSQQADAQQQENMRIAQVVLKTQYGQNVSVASDGFMVADEPTASGSFTLNGSNHFGRYYFAHDPSDPNAGDNTDFVDEVQQLIGGGQGVDSTSGQNVVSVYQCANAQGALTPCARIETTVRKGQAANGLPKRATGDSLDPAVYSLLANRVSNHTDPSIPVADVVGPRMVDNIQYAGDYSPIFNSDGHWIGVIFVGVPQSIYTSVVTRTTTYLIIIGALVMLGAVILALIFANTIVSTLQRAARQVSGASERIGSIAEQQSNGSAQQVWAINAINQALQNFSETARDISQRTDQLALMGNQVLQRRQEISPTQIDSILAYITRSVRDISVATRQQAAQYERMTGAMQAVIEIADQVANNSKQSTESSQRLDQVVGQLQQLVGVRLARRQQVADQLGMDNAPELTARAPRAPSSAVQQGTIRAVRPGGRNNGMSAQLGGQQSQRMLPAGGAMRADAGGVPGGVGRGQPEQYGGMAVSGGRISGAQMAPAGQMRFGHMQAPNSGPGLARAMSGPRQGMAMPDDMDYRLPPMPEMPPMPDWGGPMPNGAPARPEARGPWGDAPRGRGGQGGMSGPHSNPFAGGGDW